MYMEGNNVVLIKWSLGVCEYFLFGLPYPCTQGTSAVVDDDVSVVFFLIYAYYSSAKSELRRYTGNVGLFLKVRYL